MPSFQTIITIIAVTLLLYVVYKYVTKDLSKLTNLTSAEIATVVSLPTTASTATTSNFAYSIWFYIDNWNYMNGLQKTVFQRQATNTDSASTYCPQVVLDAFLNNLIITLATTPSSAATTSDSVTATIENIPIQTWVNVIVSVYTRTLDVYLNGKLVITKVMPGIATPYTNGSNTSVEVTPNGGFSGWTSTFQYWPNAITPQQAFNVYSKGYGASRFANLFGTYDVKVTVTKDGAAETSMAF